MAITPRTLNLRGASSDHIMVPRMEATRSHFCDPRTGGINLDIRGGGPLGVVIVGPWQDTVEGQDVVIVASAEQRGLLTIEASNDENPTEPASALVLGTVEHEPQGARVQVTARKYRVTFTPSAPCDRVHIETQSRA